MKKPKQNIEETDLKITTPKTATIKATNLDDKMRLFTFFNGFTTVCSKVKDDIYNFGQNEDTLPVYTDYIKASQRARMCATTLATKSECDFAKKYGEHFPLPHYNQEGMNYTTHQHTYSVNSAVHTQLDSLNECDKLTNGEYVKLKKTVDELEEKLTEEHGKEPLDFLVKFVDEQILLGWRFDGKFRLFFEVAMLPELKNGNIIYKKAYKTSGGKGRRYSFYNPSVADNISKNPTVWNLLSDVKAVDYISLSNSLLRKKPHAQYTNTTLNRAQVRPTFGNNGVPFSISVSDDDYVYIRFRLPKKDGEEKGQEISVKCSYKTSYKGKRSKTLRKSCYLGNLKIEENGKGKYICKYNINGRETTTAELNECFLRVRINNNRWFNKYLNGTLTKEDGVLKSEYFDFYFDLCLNVHQKSIHGLTNSEIFGGKGKSIRSYYSTSYPEVKNLDGQKNIKTDFGCYVDKPHNIMGIDLGQRNPFAWAVLDQNGNVKDVGHLDGAENDTYKDYLTFSNRCKDVKNLILQSRDYLYGDDEAIDETLFDSVVQFVNSNITLNKYKSYLDEKKSLINKESLEKNRLYELKKKDHGWFVRDCLWFLTKEYHRINSERKTHSDWRYTLYWVDAIHRFIDVNKSFNSLGSYYDKKQSKSINGIQKDFCRSYWNQIDNLNEDTLKKFVFELLPVIKKNNVCLIAIEELKSMLGDDDKRAEDNRLYNLWPVGQLKTFLEGKLLPYNVAVMEVSEQNTSQIVNGQWSYREGDDLYYVKNNDNNTMCKTHADENAAINIALRAYSHHTNLYSIYMINPIDDYYVPSCIWNNKDEGSKRIRGFLTKTYGTSDVVFIKKNEKLVKSDVSIKDVKRIVKNIGNEKNKKSEIWYRMNDIEWIDEGSRDIIINTIKSKVR